MPELPEVETVARQLKPRLTGRRLERLQILDAKLWTPNADSVHGGRIADVRRRGKWVLIRVQTRAGRQTAKYLAFHLRMTGRLLWTPDGAVNGERPPRVRLQFDRGALLFEDVRRFGMMRLIDRPDDIACGIDPLSRTLTPEALSSLIGDSRQPLKVWLMRQDRLTGLGNIYCSEIPFDCRIDPRRPACDLSREEVRRLLASIRGILRRAIRNCGVTFSDFQDSNGEIGSYQRFLRVYGRKGEPCDRCGAEIERIVQQQRSTFFCPDCQQQAP